MIKTARLIIAAAETDLGQLSRGQRVDLLMDNTNWPLETCQAIAREISDADQRKQETLEWLGLR